MAAAVVLLSLLFASSSFTEINGIGIGVNYGRMADNLPAPSQVAQFLVQATVIDRVKLYDADPSTLQAFANTDIAITVAVPNDVIPKLTDLSFARHWIKVNILPYNSKITRILVGNEVVSTANRLLIASLVPAMQTLHTALVGVSLHRRIKISSPHSLGILSASDPPSVGQFKRGYDTAVIQPLLSFLRATGSPFMINAYPFFGCSPSTLDYALFRPNPGVVDSNTNLTYTNMLDGQLDAVYSAMKLLGFKDVSIAIAETGWPSLGEAWQVGVDVDNARRYNKNLVQHVTSGTGTPLMPNRTFETYIFSLFNEDLKPGPLSERNFGLFHPDMTPVYDIGILKRRDGSEPVSSVAPSTNATQSDVKKWCIPRLGMDIESLQENIDFVCGQGLDCNPIQSGGLCFFPDTVQSHAAYAMNLYFQDAGKNFFDCDFGQTGVITNVDPSYGSCKYNS